MTAISHTKVRSRNRRLQRRKNAVIFRMLKIVGGFCFFLVAILCLSGSKEDQSLRSKIHNFVESELVGYGPSHPRAAMILVATEDLSDPLDNMKKSIESILSHTDRNRIFVICAVFEKGVLTKGQEKEAQAELDKLDKGTSSHWHGTVKHTHENESASHKHGQKIKAMFLNGNSVSASRHDAANYVQILARSHEEKGYKSPKEDIITVFIRPDSEIETDHWVDTVSNALIGADDEKTSNAISFASSSTETISEGETKSATLELKPIKSHASEDAMSLTQRQSYPTPVVDGAVTVMTLETFLNLPIYDDKLNSHFASDLEMSFNLWMCADGIDIVTVLRAKTTLGVLQHKDKAGVSPTSAARLAHTWMGGNRHNIGKQVLHLVEKSGVDMASLSLDDTPDPVKGDVCRPFSWYTSDVNVAMDKELRNLPRIIDKPRKRFVPPKKADEPEVKEPKPPVDKPKIKEKEPEKKPLVEESNPEKGASNETEEVGQKPSKPLRETNKEIISTAKMVDLAFVDASGGNKEHPHMGALDENDQPGYIHDAAALHKNPPQFNFTPQEVQCSKKDGTMKMLTEKVSVDIPAHEAAESLARSGVKPRAKIFCLVYTIEKFHDRIPNIRETWGNKCDGFMVGSTKTDKSIDAVNILHEGPEDYHNIWQKVRSMWSYIYDNYYEDYDWFHIGGDDLYLLVENLRLYLESEEIQLASNGGEVLHIGKPTKQLPLFLGRRFKEGGNVERIFNSGGSGYTMNKAALKALVVDAFPTCMPHLKTFAEDVMVAQCFRNKLEVFPYDTKDDEGGERYMPFQPKHHLTYRIPENVKDDWYANYSIDIKTGLDHCAAGSVAFHYIKGDLMKRIHAILYGHCA